MNTEQVIKELKSRVKPYNQIDPVMPQSTYSRTVRDIEHGHAKQSTIVCFFTKFGYTQNDITWTKER